jgi:predicted nucleic acid-binding protein
MIAVADTSPLNYLILIGEVELLPRMFSRVVIPPAVRAELCHERTPPVVSSWVSRLPSWVEIVSADESSVGHALGRGEAEAIAVARRIAADITLIDERKAALVARQHGLTVTGTLGVLDLAAEKGIVDLNVAVLRLLETNFRVSPPVVEELLSRHR